MTDGIELNGCQSEIIEVPSSESENEQVQWAAERYQDFCGLPKDTKLSKQKSEGTWSDRRAQSYAARSLAESKSHRFDPVVFNPFQPDFYRLPEDTKLSKQKSKGTCSDQGAQSYAAQSLTESKPHGFDPVESDPALFYGLRKDTKLSKQKSEGTWSDQRAQSYAAQSLAESKSHRFDPVVFNPFPPDFYRLPEDTKLSKQKSKGTCSDQRAQSYAAQSLAESKPHGFDPVEFDPALFYGLRKDTKLSKQKSEGTWSDQSVALLITVMSLFAGAAYMVLFSFHDAFPISSEFKGVVNLSILELLTFPKTATDDFLVIATVTTTFILSMGMNTIAVCIFFRKFIRGTFLTILSLFTIVAFSVSFFAMLSKFFPHHITIAGGNLKIPATAIVIFYDTYVIILVCAFAYTVHRWQSSRHKQDAVSSVSQ